MPSDALIESFNALINLVTVALITRAVRDVRSMKDSLQDDIEPELRRNRRSW